MIIEFSIQNFKGIKDKVTLTFEPENSKRLEDFYLISPMPGVKLLKLGVIYGANGSGKTTILQALVLLRSMILHPVVQKTEKLEFEPFLFDEVTQQAPTTFSLKFVSNGRKYLYEIAVSRDAVLQEKLIHYNPNKALVFERATNADRQLSTIKFGSKIKIKKAEANTLITNTLWNNLVLSTFLRTNVDSVEMREATEWFIDVLNGWIQPGTNLFYDVNDYISENVHSRLNVLQFLKKADLGIVDIFVEKKVQQVDENVKQLANLLSRQLAATVRNTGIFDADTIEQIEVLFEHAIKKDNKVKKYKLPYDQESQGTKRYFQFSGVLSKMLELPQVYLIDELESSLHPDLIKHFLLLFLVNVTKSQLLVTTHHRELLMERDMLREDAIWFTERKNEGGIELYELSDFDSSVVRDTLSVFNAYKSGKLGAVPALSDYYIHNHHEK
ncbi:ATP/GTP-binding protein [Chitinophaga sp. Cy-1792]|uniref:AAA family ATPase n=1 Tax=Chitinophaga sp. Cy-1792 TaxID=2608339 RepID=UPI00141DD22E|nr:AAA family ATPase [Chitinophaga sp. Cy-1792]NIG53911.1 AAA family ATPase [Chitinophaga sp. Cy-1792]